MKNSMLALLVGISTTALLAGGCANNSTVKKEDSVVPAVTSDKVVPAKPAEAVEQSKPVEKAKPVEQAKPAEKSNQAPIEAAKEALPPTEKTAVPGNVFETVYFDFDKSDLRQDARDVLSKNAETILKTMANGKVQIEGHCDERGSAEYNLALGERRAKAAQKYLTTLGVKAENLSVISYGKEKPAVSGNDEAAWSKNRRDEFVVVK